MNRFKAVNVNNFIDEHENINTVKKTFSHLKLMNEFLTIHKENRPIHAIPPTELDDYLSEFILSVRTKGNNEYEPSSLRGMIGSFDRHLRKRNYETTIMGGGRQFSKTRDALKAKQKDLKGQGKGSKPNRADPLLDHQIDQLYDFKQLGKQNPNSVLNTLWYLNTLHFGMRGGSTEHRAMCWGDVILKHDDERKVDFLEYHERATKTRTGDDVTNTRVCPPRMYATPDNPERCPIQLYMFYQAKRPQDYCDRHDPFYLAAITNEKNPAVQDKWFLRGPVGKNKLDNIMKNMAKAAYLPEKHLTNTSVRKTLVQKMTDHHVPDNLQTYITGHKNSQSLNNYRTLNDNQKFSISNILSRNSSCSSTITSSSTSNESTWPQQILRAPNDPREAQPLSTTVSTPSDSSNKYDSLFAGSYLNNCSITVNISNTIQPPVKRRRIIYDSDSQ